MDSKNEPLYASFFERFLAFLIDLVVFIFTFLMIGYFLSKNFSLSKENQKGVLEILMVILIIFLEPIFNTVLKGKSVGKLLIGIRIKMDSEKNLVFLITCLDRLKKYLWVDCL